MSADASLSVNELPQLAECNEAKEGLRLLPNTGAGGWIEHPCRDQTLGAIRQLNDHAVGLMPRATPKDLHILAMEWMVRIANTLDR